MERITSLTKLQPPFSVFSLNYYLTNKDCPLHRRALLYPISNLTSPPRAREWPDGFGRPPAVRDLAWRMAADGHSMLAPNPFFGLTASLKLRSPARLHSTSRIQPTGGTPINPRRVTIRCGWSMIACMRFFTVFLTTVLLTVSTALAQDARATPADW